MRGYALLVMGMAFGSMACNNSAKARLEIDNLTGVGASGLSGSSVGGLKLESITPARRGHFAMKLSGVSLAPDVDPVTQNNIGEVAELWVSPNCTSADDCPFFNFARPTSEVNAELNSQQRDVTPGSYRYVRIQRSATTATRRRGRTSRGRAATSRGRRRSSRGAAA